MLLVVVSIFILSLCVSAGNAANILGIFTSTSQSHIIVHMATVRALTERGHNVTVVTILPLKERNASYHHIYVPPSEEDYAEYRRTISDAATGVSWFNSLRKLFLSNVQRVRMQDKALRHPQFQELLNNTGNHFDLVILGFAYNTFELGVAAHFKCPVIVSWVNVPMENLLSLVGNPLAVSSVPILPTSSNQGLSSFGQRVENFFLTGVFMPIDRFSEFKMAQYYEEHFPAERYPSYDEMKRNVSLVFCSTHFSEGLIRPIVPGFIEIGGIQVKEKPDPLPEDIQEFLKTAYKGFILFTLGTNIKTTDLSANTTRAIFNILSKTKQKVLWKWDSGKTPGISSNIMYRKWFPQVDLLAHPRLRLFITHAGKGSVVEAQYHGIPMLAIPVIGDQFAISQRMQAMGYGLIVDHRNITEENFRSQLQEVLTNSSYLKAALKFSTVYRDRPISAKQSVIYWTEYVIRHRGARHIQSSAVHMNFFQKNSLDVIGFFILVLYLIYIVLRGLIKMLFYVFVVKKKLKIE